MAFSFCLLLVDIKRDFDTDLIVFHKGEIFTLESKEVALKRFLEHIPEHKFQKIIFVDDKRKNLEKVKNFTEKSERGSSTHYLLKEF